MRIDGDGNVGIATSTPGSKLQIATSNQFRVWINAGDNIAYDITT